MPKPARLRYVHEYTDRLGKRRWYFRKGKIKVSLPAPGSAEFTDAYNAAAGGNVPPRAALAPAGSIGALVARYQQSVHFTNKIKASSRTAYRFALGPVLAAHGHRSVAGLTRDHARQIIERIGASRGPGIANTTKAVLSKIFKFAMDLNMRADNPFSGLTRYDLGTHHTWTDDEISAYEAQWSLGTRERLALALLLYTGQRGGDVAKMKRSDVKDGSIRVVQEKTSEDDDDEMWIPIHPELARALKAGPANGLNLIGHRNGRPITRKHLTDLIVAAGGKAGLPRKCVPHGLRKAALRRLAESGATTNQIAAISGHKSLKEIERYTKRADQRKLAQSAVDGLKRSG
jgi:integrase